MQLKILGTGSAGNCYILENNKEALIIELGLSFSKIKQALNFDLSKVVGALVTHEHGDHVGKNKEGLLGALNNGIEVYSGQGTFDVLNIKNHNCRNFKKGGYTEIGSFKVLPFKAIHCNNDGSECAEPINFIIEHDECGCVLFVTDSLYCGPRFTDYSIKFNNIIIEANYCEEIIKKNLEKGKLPVYLYNRILKSHMSLNTCKETLLANDLSQVQKIVLIHLSDSNSDEKKFKEVITNATGKIVHVANNNQTIEFNKNPF
ncbi:MBL fold metallo-hydrolase [Chishuiella sp.]|uniref:MBL fold metallo-hydrolase n=1 Tax=Chishuiella sp. TaxID=1969467 RepID=UPI0028B14DAE|nr:MBL fold metallo-hydrolase [Chishuiella sp.]